MILVLENSLNLLLWSKALNCVQITDFNHLSCISFLDANAGQVSDGRRAEGSQTKDHPLSAR